LQQPKTRQIHSLATTKKMTREQTKLPPLKKNPSEDHTDTKIDAKILAPQVMPQISTPEADAWPTEAMGAADLDSLGEVYGAERTRIGAAPYQEAEESDAEGRSFARRKRCASWSGVMATASFASRHSERACPP
jgi:hypothetical protein